jgi:hypothetical protein
MTAMSKPHSIVLLAVTALVAGSQTASAERLGCGFGISDWCPAPPGDPCGRHRNVAACMADPACYGMPYRGESVVACIFDRRGFASNCPTVGCTSTPPPRGGR